MNNGLDAGDVSSFQNIHHQLANKTFDGASSNGRPVSGMDAIRKTDFDVDMDAQSQATGAKAKRMAQNQARPKSAYSATARNKNREKLIQEE